MNMINVWLAGSIVLKNQIDIYEQTCRGFLVINDIHS